MIEPAVHSTGSVFIEAAPGRSPIVAVSRILNARLAMLALVFILWVVCSPYYEIDHSSLIYAGRALASLDPSGIGRDIMFVHDGQSGFTLFTGLYQILVGGFGLATASALVAAAAVVVGFIGAAVLAGALCEGPTRWVAIAFAATLPAFYGGYKIFSYAETAATPRPFAEALVLIGLAALLRGRLGPAALAMTAAATLHPIMALPGLMVIAIWLVIADRRYLLPIGSVLVATGVLVLWHVAPFDRVLAPLDPAWKAVLVNRNPQIFPSLWPDGCIGRLAARATALLIAASLTRGAGRKLCVITLFVGIAGVAASYLLSERLPLLLPIQAQLWRSLWLVFSLATLACATCAVELWRKDGTSRVVLALLALAWVYADYDRAIVFDIMALAFHFWLRESVCPLSRRTVGAIVVVAAILGVCGLVWSEYVIAMSLGTIARDQFAEARNILAIDWDYTPLGILVAIAIIGGLLPRRPPIVGAIALCGLVLIVATWDRRSLENRYFDTAAPVDDLRALIDTKLGEVFWVDGGRETWTWLARPQWLSAIQGAGLVFSRPLAMLYRDRADLAIAAGLADETILAPFGDRPHEVSASLDPVKIATFCAAPGAPAWLVVPAGDERPDPALHSVRWAAPLARLTPRVDAEGAIAWRTVGRYDIMACAP